MGGLFALVRVVSECASVCRVVTTVIPRRTH